MNKCLKVSFLADHPEGFLHDFIKKHATRLNLEGTVQVVGVNNKVRVVVCGPKGSVDEFVDLLHKGDNHYMPQEIEVEAFATDKDYRGVFRVIE